MDEREIDSSDGATFNRMSPRRVAHVRTGHFLLLIAFVPVWASSGCASPTTTHAASSVDRVSLKREALATLKMAITYPDNPVVRVEAIEAMQTSGVDEVRPWIRTALADEHAAVRFAACVALGVLRDRGARETLGRLVTEEDPNVRVAAAFALHRLGETAYSGLMPKALLESEDVTVRRNAALVLGLLKEQGVVRVLARAMKDRDEGVRHHALEGMVRLGNRDAGQELLFMTNAGVGSEEVFAVSALASAQNRMYFDTFAYKLATAPHIETKLAAARGLGLLGDERGLDLALQALSYDTPPRGSPDDPPEAQRLRVRQLAASALGAIGNRNALPALARIMRRDPDPRMQVSAAKAVLEILRTDRTRGLPFPVS